MLPSSEIRLLRRTAIGLSLLAALVAVTLVPARHALLEIWPARVQELVLPDGELRFRQATEPNLNPPVLASSYPLTLLALEFEDGRVDHGFLIHRDVETRTWWVRSVDGLQAVDAQSLHRHYAPNAMDPGERLALMRERVIERRAGRLLPSGGSPDFAVPASAESDDL